MYVSTCLCPGLVSGGQVNRGVCLLVWLVFCGCCLLPQAHEQHVLVQRRRKSELIDLSVEYGVVTKWTSFVAVEERSEEEKQALARGELPDSGALLLVYRGSLALPLRRAPSRLLAPWRTHLGPHTILTSARIALCRTNQLPTPCGWRSLWRLVRRTALPQCRGARHVTQAMPQPLLQRPHGNTCVVPSPTAARLA